MIHCIRKVNLGVALLSSTLVLLTLGGCASPEMVPSVDTKKTEPNINKQPIHSNAVAAQTVQTSRYVTKKIGAKAYQNDPLLSVVSFHFGPSVKTVGEAVDQMLAPTGYSLAPSLSDAVLLTLNKPLPQSNRSLGPISIQNALIVLMGADVFYLRRDPLHRLIDFGVKPELLHLVGSKKALKHPSVEQAQGGHYQANSPLKINRATTPLGHYLLHSHYTQRISPFLVRDGLKANSTQQAVLKFTKTHPVFFGFNDKASIVGIAKSQIIANALSKSPQEVFFALSGQSLKDTITRWAKLSDVHLFWNTDKNLKLEASSAYLGTLYSQSGSLVKLLRSAKRAGVPLKAELEPNNVLIISDRSYHSLFLSPNASGA